MPHAARPTVPLRDVAKQAGVSLATASRVLGPSSRKVGSEYRERVLAAAAAMGYTVDAAARAMRGTSDSITLIADDLTTPSIATVVAAMEREARTAGAFVTVSSTGGTYSPFRSEGHPSGNHCKFGHPFLDTCSGCRATVQSHVRSS